MCMYIYAFLGFMISGYLFLALIHSVFYHPKEMINAVLLTY